MKIVIIEDDPDIAELLEFNFKQEKWGVSVFARGADGLKKIPAILPDLVVLDLMLPDVSGLDICRTVKSNPKTRHIPILMLTAKGEEIDRVLGFELGADDYVTKPFSPRELMLRVKAILKRVKAPDSAAAREEPVAFGSLRFDPVKYEVTVSGQQVQLTAIEFKLLQYFLANKGRVATRDALLDKVWGYDAALTTRTVDTHIKRLREKLGRAGDYIETIRGMGYRFREAP